MTSFNDVLDRLVRILEEDEGVQNFAMDRWLSRITIKRVFKRRTEVNASELPLIMMTRPRLAQTPMLGGPESRKNDNTVTLYILFVQPDAEKAQQDIIAIEELVDDCLNRNYRIKDANGNPLVKSVFPIESANDEGLYHPNYSIVKDLKIEHRR